MSEISEFSSGKGHTDENFPVASVLIHPRYRAPILAFYRFVRAADDVADNPTAAPEVKLEALEQLRLGLIGQANGGQSNGGEAAGGEANGPPEAVALRWELQARGLTDRHALDLLEAFRRDVTKLRYADWYDLVDYCRWSAMPVGRFVLDVHGESRELWPANDALCAALQVINHLQDCAKDYRELDRVYIPEDLLAKNGASVQMLGEPTSPPELKRTIRDVARLTLALLGESRPFSSQIRDGRLALEVEVIQRLAEDLGSKLMRRDPLCEKVHHSKPEALARAVGIVGAFALSRAVGRRERARASEAEA